jgi:hypothetical protein
MRFESQWPGDAIAAPVYGMYDREDAFFDCVGGRSWNGVDSARIWLMRIRPRLS